MGPSSVPPLLLLNLSAVPRRLVRPARAQSAAIPTAPPNGFSNVPRACAFVLHSFQNASETSSRLTPALQFLCSLSQPFVSPEGASRLAASPAKASQATAAPAGQRLRGPLYSTQKCRQSPSSRPSCFECHPPAPAPEPPARTPPGAQCQFRLAPRPPSRSARASSPQHRPTALLRQLPAQARQE